MDRFFAIGSKVLSFFEKTFSLETYRPFLEDPYWAGGILFSMGLMVFAVLKKRQVHRYGLRKKQEELELALLDEDPESRALDLPEPARLEDDDGGIEFNYEDFAAEDAEGPDPWQGDFKPDPAFGNQIIITAQSSRKIGPEAIAEPESKPETEGYPLEIEEEFAQLEEELKEKEQEVLQKHRIPDDLHPAPAPAAETTPDEKPPVIVLTLNDLVEGEEPPLDESGIFSEGDLEELWSTSDNISHQLAESPEVSEFERMEREMEEVIEDLTQKLDYPEAEYLPRTEPFPESTAPSPQRKFDRLIQRLEEFQKDMEHRLQSRTLETLTQRNLELVKSLKTPLQPEEGPEEAARAQVEARTALEKLAYPKRSSWL